MSVSENDRKFFVESFQRIQLSDDVNNDSVEPDYDAMIYSLVSTYLNAGPTAFAELVDEHRTQLTIACMMSEDLYRIVLIGLRMGIDENNGACANELGALYYTGDIVEQDYAKAAEYYEIAANLGNIQSMVNLGYIYEYGRTGAPDYAKAYMYYSFAAAAFQNAEALYKMGDMFSAGKGVEQSKNAAITLWQQSFDSSEDPEIKAQPALRMAQVLVDPEECKKLGVKHDPLMALQLFQTAEIGLRMSIANGLSYYERRLDEAIDGQKHARQLLDQ